MRVVDVEHFLGTLKSVVEKNGSEEWRKIANTMAYMVGTEATLCGRDIVTCGECKYADHSPNGRVYCMNNSAFWDRDEFCSRGERDDE